MAPFEYFCTYNTFIIGRISAPTSSLEVFVIPNTPTKRSKIAQTPTDIVIEPVEDQPSEFKVIGFEMFDREVKQSGNTGRVYLPKDWIGKRVKIIRVSKLDHK
ncbi:MAG: DUF2080 family transposase-associated protein [Candidatus Hodarchaeales archaeon]